MTLGPLAKTPFYFLESRPDREAELAARIRHEHRRGRRLEEVLNDPYVRLRGSRGVLHAVLLRPDLIRAFGHDVVEAILRDRATLLFGHEEAR